MASDRIFLITLMIQNHFSKGEQHQKQSLEMTLYYIKA